MKRKVMKTGKKRIRRKNKIRNWKGRNDNKLNEQREAEKEQNGKKYKEN